MTWSFVIKPVVPHFVKGLQVYILKSSIWTLPHFWIWIFDSRPENPVLGMIFCVDFEFAVKICGFRRPAGKFDEQRPRKTIFKFVFLVFIYIFFHAGAVLGAEAAERKRDATLAVDDLMHMTRETSECLGPCAVSFFFCSLLKDQFTPRWLNRLFKWYYIKRIF